MRDLQVGDLVLLNATRDRGVVTEITDTQIKVEDNVGAHTAVPRDASITVLLTREDRYSRPGMKDRLGYLLDAGDIVHVTLVSGINSLKAVVDEIGDDYAVLSFTQNRKATVRIESAESWKVTKLRRAESRRSVIWEMLSSPPQRDFRGMSLHGLDLSGKNLSFADFTDAGLTNVNFAGTNLFGTKGIQHAAFVCPLGKGQVRIICMLLDGVRQYFWDYADETTGTASEKFKGTEEDILGFLRSRGREDLAVNAIRLLNDALPG